MAPVEPEAQRPNRTLRPSALNRHQLDLFGGSTYVARKSTMALPGIDVADEIARINRGEGTPLDGSRWRINGRVYIDKGDGRTYPESGEGIITPSRLELIGLRYLIKSGGDTTDLHERTQFDLNFDEKIRSSALGLYAIWKDARDNQP